MPRKKQLVGRVFRLCQPGSTPGAFTILVQDVYPCNNTRACMEAGRSGRCKNLLAKGLIVQIKDKKLCKELNLTFLESKYDFCIGSPLIWEDITDEWGKEEKKDGIILDKVKKSKIQEKWEVLAAMLNIRRIR